jgi:hypothetical protein
MIYRRWQKLPCGFRYPSRFTALDVSAGVCLEALIVAIDCQIIAQQPKHVAMTSRARGEEDDASNFHGC